MEISWFAALCDDDYELLGVPDPRLASSYDHCAGIVSEAERWGFDNILLPSGYALGIDTVAFAAAVAPRTERIRLLVAVRCGEVWPPQLARQLATLDHLLGGRLTVNVISSDLPGESLASAPRYGRTLEVMGVLRDLLDGRPVDHHGTAYDLRVDPPRLGTVSGRCPPLYFGGLSEPAREVAARQADARRSRGLRTRDQIDKSARDQRTRVCGRVGMPGGGAAVVGLGLKNRGDARDEIITIGRDINQIRV